MHKEFFVWHQGALGDLLLSLPAIHSIRSTSKDIRLHLAGRADLAELILSNVLADEFSSNEKGLYADFFVRGSFSASLGSFLKRFSRAFIFLNKIDPVLMENLREFIPECHQIRTRPTDGLNIHVSEYQRAQVHQAMRGAPDLETGRTIPDSGVQARGNDRVPSSSALPDDVVAPFPILKTGPPFCGIEGRKVISIHPGSGSEKKCWPVEYYLTLPSELDPGRTCRFFFILGPSESPEKHKKIRAFISEKRIDAELISGKPLSFIAGLLKISSLYLGNDSGITHLASAVGVPVIALFGPTDPDIWGPVGANAKIIRSAAPCSPCSDDNYRKCGDARCMRDIDIQKVAWEIGNIFGADGT